MYYKLVLNLNIAPTNASYEYYKLCYLKWYAKCAPKLVHCTNCIELVHGALHQNCADLKSHTKCVPKLVHGALHQNCADLKSTIQSVHQSWCMVHGALHQNCADLKFHTKCVPKFVHGAWCIAPELC